MERMALAVASGLATRGHSVRVIASGWNDGAFRRRLEERGLPYACASEFVAAGLRKLDAAPEKMRVIYNGIDPVISQRDASQRPIPTIGIVGQIGEWKGHDDLIQAIAIAKRKGTVLHAHIFGDGEQAYVTALKAKAAVLGVDGLITWRGYVRDPDAIYSEIDICVVRSRIAEGFGLTAVEAGLRRIPAVATRRGALPGIVFDNETGFLIGGC